MTAKLGTGRGYGLSVVQTGSMIRRGRVFRRLVVMVEISSSETTLSSVPEGSSFGLIGTSVTMPCPGLARYVA